jgi:hypothetical protein
MSEKSVVELRGLRVAGTPAETEAGQLLSEVRELFEQYQNEVPKKRKPWPESIRTRIVALWGLGVGNHQISMESKVPVQTLYSWRQRIKRGKEPGFKQITIARSPRRTGFQIRMDEERRRANLQLSQLEVASEAKPTTVTVVLLNVIRVEGLSAVGAAELIRSLA